MGAAAGLPVTPNTNVGESDALGVGTAEGPAVGVSEGEELVDGADEGAELVVGEALDVGVPVVGISEGMALMDGVVEGKVLGESVGLGVTTSSPLLIRTVLRLV